MERPLNDLDALRLNNPLPQIASQMAPMAGIVADGRDFIGCCPFHEEDTPSFTIFLGRKDNRWRYHCFGCDAHGDVIDFVEHIKGVSTGEAIRILGGAGAGPNVAPIPAVAAVDPYAGIVVLDPKNEIAAGRKLVLYNPKRERMGNITPSMVFPYRREDGSIMGYVLRHELPEGGKETPSVHWVRLPNGQECWARFPFPKPRPLYNLHLVGGASQVIVVEGEKCADRLAEHMHRAVVSWPGGTNGVIHTDWSPLSGKSVVIVPDFDGPGAAAALSIKKQLEGVASSVRLVDLFQFKDIQVA